MLIASGTNSASFYYGDTKAATPTITASGSLTSATQTETVTAAAAGKLAFGQQPTNTAHGTTITPAVTVTVLDTFGNQATGTNSVTIAIGNNAGFLGGGALLGTLTHNAVAGIATFNDLSISGLFPIGNGYTLTIASTALTGATSNPFNIT